MKVIATQLGYYNHVRQKEGFEFELLKSDDVSIQWMKPADAEAEKAWAKKWDALPDNVKESWIGEKWSLEKSSAKTVKAKKPKAVAVEQDVVVASDEDVI